MRLRSILIAGLGMVWAFHATAQVNLAVQTGAGQIIRQGAFAPVEIIASTEDEDYDGTLFARFVRGSTGESIVSRPLALPANSSKRVFLYLTPSAYEDDVHVWYEDESGDTIAEFREAVKWLDVDTPLLGIVGEQFPGLPPDEDENTRDRHYYRAFLRLGQLPPAAEGLDMYDALVISPPPEKPLSSAQITALRQWVGAGGVLVLDQSRRTDALQQADFTALLPFVPQGASEGALPLGEDPVLIATGALRPGARVLYGTEDAPLIATQPYGLGLIGATAFPLANGDFMSGDDPVESLWYRILPDSFRPADSLEGALNNFQQGPAYSEFSKYEAQMAEAVTEAPSTRLRLSVVFILTALYALAAGPGDYLLVRRIFRKPRLTWITFPIIVLTFTVLSYLGARYWIGGDLETKHVRTSFYFPNDDLAYTFDVSGVFVPRGDDYHLEGSGGGLLRHLSGSLGSVDPSTYDQETGELVQRIPIWTHRTFSEVALADAPPIDIAATQNANGTIDIAITNRGNERLSWVEVITAEGLHSPPVSDRDIGVGQTASVTVDTDTLTPLRARSRMPLLALNGDELTPPLARPLRIAEALERGAIAITLAHPPFTPAFRVDDIEPAPEEGRADVYTVAILTPERN